MKMTCIGKKIHLHHQLRLSRSTVHFPLAFLNESALKTTDSASSVLLLLTKVSSQSYTPLTGPANFMWAEFLFEWEKRLWQSKQH